MENEESNCEIGFSVETFKETIIIPRGTHNTAKVMRFPDKEEYESYLKKDPATWEELCYETEP